MPERGGEIERLVDVLEAIDSNPDLENTGDDEPTLGLPVSPSENCPIFNPNELPNVGQLDDDRELDEAEGRLGDAGATSLSTTRTHGGW